MKLMFASDIHGSAYYCRRMLEAFEEERADKLILLGDLLYHGPRNDLPRDYAPKEVISLLNSNKNRICAVRGNCDADVDQMVLDFPVMASYCIVYTGTRMVYAAHGHEYSMDNLPPVNDGDIFIQGHTHIPAAELREEKIFLNPGSISIPKENYPPSYGIMDQEQFQVKDFDGNLIKRLYF